MKRIGLLAIVLFALAWASARPADRFTFVHKGWDQATDSAILEPIYPLRLGAVAMNAEANAALPGDVLDCTVRTEGVKIRIAGEPGEHNLNRIYLSCGGAEYAVLGVQFER
jgi:hypothetical protein